VHIVVTDSLVLLSNVPFVSCASREKNRPSGHVCLAGDYAILIVARMLPQRGCIVLAIGSG
jgi:hypothetical protein